MARRSHAGATCRGRVTAPSRGAVYVCAMQRLAIMCFSVAVFTAPVSAQPAAPPAEPPATPADQPPNAPAQPPAERAATPPPTPAPAPSTSTEGPKKLTVGKDSPGA